VELIVESTGTTAHQATGVYLGTVNGDITPPLGSDLSGFIARTEPMAGVHDPLIVKAMVWAEDSALTNAAALVTLDVVDVAASEVATIRERVSALTGIPGERVGITCTHTHGGPATMPDGRLGRCDVAYLDGVCQTAAETVAAATHALEPVVMRWASGDEPTVGKNRRIPGGIIDPAVPVLRFQRHDGTVAALLVSYGCHPVTLGPNNLQATADYPGYVRRTLEAVYPGATAHFVTGCCGQVNNGHTSRDGDKGRGMHWRTFAESERIGRAIAGAAMQAAEQAARIDAALPVTDVEVLPARVRTARRTVPLPFLPTPETAELERLAAAWRAEAREVEQRERRPGELERLQVFLAWAEEVRSGPAVAAVEAEVMVIAIGDVTLALLPGESFVEFGLEIKERTAPRRVVTLAYANGRPGYIPHRSAYPAGGYEVDEAFRYYGYPACFAPEAGEALVATAIALVAEVSAG
jgi:neutral ceramidase